MDAVTALKARAVALVSAVEAMALATTELEAKVGAKDSAGLESVVKKCAALDAEAAQAALDPAKKDSAEALHDAAQSMLPKALCAKQLMGVAAVAKMIGDHIEQATEMASQQAAVVGRHVD